MVVQSCPHQVLVVKLKAQGADEVQRRPAVYREPDDIAGIGGDFRAVKYNVYHNKMFLQGQAPA